jgi:hypothetical protein
LEIIEEKISNMRKIILFILGLVVLAGAIYIANGFISKKQIPKPQERKIITSVFTETVRNQKIPIWITSSGNLTAKYRLELYSEVQGVLIGSDREFKPGMWYKKGETLLNLNSDEHLATLRSQKSSFYNQVVLLLPDLRLDFPEAFPDWEEYVRQFDIESSIIELPAPKSEKENLFITGKNLFTAYYGVKNLEERLSKYTIRAPYSGVLTEALVTPGTLIRAGQKLGEFINPNVYELEVPVNVSYSELVSIGQTVNVHNLERTKNWTGNVIRINSLVDQGTQSIQVFIKVSGKDLKEGMFLEADLQAREENNAFEVSRKLLVDDEKLFIIRDSVLDVVLIDPVYYKESSVVIKGLEDGTKILAKPVVGAYAGMKVQIFEDLTPTE